MDTNVLPSPPAEGEASRIAKSKMRRDRIARRDARRAALRLEHPDLSEEALIELDRANMRAVEAEESRIAAELRALKAKKGPSPEIAGSGQVLHPLDGWHVVKDTWAFCRQLYRLYGIVLEFGEFSQLRKAATAVTPDGTPPIWRVVHQRTGIEVCLRLSHRGMPSTCLPYSRDAEDAKRVAIEMRKARQEEKAARAAEEFRAAIAVREARAAEKAARKAGEKAAGKPAKTAATPPPAAKPRAPVVPLVPAGPVQVVTEGTTLRLVGALKPKVAPPPPPRLEPAPRRQGRK
ncbi:hypothetical protein [Belnapia moabensis]|uniref:hypothetical protein n=1 Tax=Belnapia moabensis TaxID=365533 RepID=UPI0005BE8C22|nr:hypothetical protein [Belnapia moabensis]